MKKPKREPGDVVSGYLEIGRNDKFEVVMNLDKDRNGIGHIVFSPRQARNLARLLNKAAREAVEEYRAAMGDPV